MNQSRELVCCILLDGFRVDLGGRKVRLPAGAQRLLALLALQDGPMHRSMTAERLWADCSRARACANLRSALWYGRRVADRSVIESSGPHLSLAPAVQVDQRQALAAARAITGGSSAPEILDRHAEMSAAFSRELLPDWCDDWLLLERERWDQARLHALDTLARQLMSTERFLPALEAALVAVAIEPIRESAHRTVIEIHLAEGNSACAMRHYQRYRGLLHRELGVAPSRRMIRLIEPLSQP